MSQRRRLAGAVAGGLPGPPTSFVGRAEELRRLGGMVAGGRLVTLHGPGGAGKTRLSLEAAARTAERFPDGVRFADLAGLHEPDACRRVAAALLEACPAVAVLATSREPLGLPAETVFPVPPMGIPPGDAGPTALEAYDATRLFLARAEGAVPGLVVSPSDAPVVARICRRLDGLPLAIELAASRRKVLSVAEIDERLADRFRLLRRPTTDDVPARQRTLRAAIDWSYALLEEPERRLLQRLSVLSGGFGLDAVEDVCAGDGVNEEELLDLLAGLVDKSLVVRGEHGGRARHRLLDSVRDFAAERCAEHEDLERLRARHLGHYLAMATRADDQLRGPDQLEWLARMDAEEDNFRAALRWGISAGDPTPTLDLIWLLQTYWVWRGNFSESRRWFDEAMARATDASPSVNRARALARWGEIAEIMGEYGAARSRYEQSLAVGRAVGDPVRIGTALLGLGEVVLLQGDLVGARPLLEDSLLEYRKAGDRERARWPVTTLARLSAAEGDLAQAAKLLQLSLSEARELGNEVGGGEASLYLARVARAQGDLVTARSLCEEALGLARRLGERSLEGGGLTALSHLELDLGQAQRALDAARSALRVGEETGRRLGMLAALEAVAAAMVTAGHPRPGARLYGAAAAFRERLGTPALLPESTGHQRQREQARLELGEQRFAGEWGRGRALSWEEATALALDDAEVAPAAAEEAPPAPPSMVLEGDVWTLWYEGSAVRLRDSRGLRFIAMLLADPGRELHVLDLAAPAGGRAVVGDAGAAIDPAARAAYRDDQGHGCHRAAARDPQQPTPYASGRHDAAAVRRGLRRPRRRRRDGRRMAVSPAAWLVDKSVLARLARPEVRRVVLPHIQAGRIAITIVTELEVGFSARSTKDYTTTRRTLLDYLVPILVAPRAEQRAREVQAVLVRRGQHRAVSIPDLLVAAVAEVEQLSVLHYDADYELVASITGQPNEWVVPRGSID